MQQREGKKVTIRILESLILKKRQPPQCACQQLAEKCSFNQLNIDFSLFTNVLPNKDYSSDNRLFLPYRPKSIFSWDYSSILVRQKKQLDEDKNWNYFWLISPKDQSVKTEPVIFETHLSFIKPTSASVLCARHIGAVDTSANKRQKSLVHMRLYSSHIKLDWGNGNSLQYSCLKNPMDRGAWWATVHGVTESHIRLSDFISYQTQRLLRTKKNFL